VRRRHFLTVSAASLGGLLIESLDGTLSRLAAQGQTVRIRLRFFTESEALIISAAAALIFPSDDSGSGAHEAGVTLYIDRQLAGPYGHDRHRYTRPPFDDNAPAEFGYQGQPTPREIYREGLAKLRGFHRLNREHQEAILHQIEATRFFHLLRHNTIEGLFCDPLHAGNANLVGWQLLGFPGPRMSNADDIEKHYGEPFRPQPTSLQQLTGTAPSPHADAAEAENDEAEP